MLACRADGACTVGGLALYPAALTLKYARSKGGKGGILTALSVQPEISLLHRQGVPQHQRRALAVCSPLKQPVAASLAHSALFDEVCLKRLRRLYSEAHGLKPKQRPEHHDPRQSAPSAGA